MRKGRDGGKKTGKNGKKKREKTDGNSGHYVIASSRPTERRPLERLTLVPKGNCLLFIPFEIYVDKFGQPKSFSSHLLISYNRV